MANLCSAALKKAGCKTCVAGNQCGVCGGTTCGVGQTCTGGKCQVIFLDVQPHAKEAGAGQQSGMQRICMYCYLIHKALVSVGNLATSLLGSLCPGKGPAGVAQLIAVPMWEEATALLLP